MVEPRIIQVGMAELAVGVGSDILRTVGLGSCVGICLIDAVRQVGGMAHIMLPEMGLYQDKQNHAKYADTAIPVLIAKMGRAGAVSSTLQAKLAGGAQMFSFYGQSDVMRIGARNLAAVERVLTELGIPVVSQHTAGNYGRTVQFSCNTGVLEVRTIGQGTFSI